MTQAADIQTQHCWSTVIIRGTFIIGATLSIQNLQMAADRLLVVVVGRT